MGKYDKILSSILCGTSDTKIRFSEMCQLLCNLGFKERIKGGHYIFTRNGIEEILNLQPKEGKAKPYQVKQVRNILLRYKIGETKNE